MVSLQARYNGLSWQCRAELVERLVALVFWTERLWRTIPSVILKRKTRSLPDRPHWQLVVGDWFIDDDWHVPCLKRSDLERQKAFLLNMFWHMDVANWLLLCPKHPDSDRPDVGCISSRDFHSRYLPLSRSAPGRKPCALTIHQINTLPPKDHPSTFERSFLVCDNHHEIRPERCVVAGLVGILGKACYQQAA